MSTKAQIIQDAYSQLRISGITTDPSPEDVSTALYRLENMMAEININVPYNFTDDPDPADLLNVDREYWHGMATNLAVRLIPDFNKAVPTTLAMQAKQSMAKMVSASTTPRTVQYPTRHPRGSGNTQRINPWYRFFRPVIRAPNTPQTNRMIVGDVQDYVESFESYLEPAEDIATYTLSADTGLTVLSQSLATPNVFYRIRADGTPNRRDGWLNVVITATTTTSRVETRVIAFTLTDVS